jgi:hypothetical protein
LEVGDVEYTLDELKNVDMSGFSLWEANVKKQVSNPKRKTKPKKRKIIVKVKKVNKKKKSVNNIQKILGRLKYFRAS